MSINMDSGGVEYADHEVQSLSFKVVNDGTGPTGIEGELLADPVQQRGIDNDELAELVGMYRFAFLQPQGAMDQTNGDVMDFEFNMGINTKGKSEALTDLSGNAEIAEDTVTGGGVTLGESDDPGILDGGGIVGSIGNDTGTVSERFIDFRDVLGSGPYVDATDDLVFQGEVSNNGSDTVNGEVEYILYWDVEELPEGRSSFARP